MSDEPGERAAAEEPTNEGPSKQRKMLWAVGLAVGGYMIVRGLWGVFTGT